jgi:hypothetical protein
MSRNLHIPLRRALHSTPSIAHRHQLPGAPPELSPTPPVSPLLTSPPKPVPSYRSPSSHTYVPPVPPPRAPLEPEVQDELDPYANFVPPRMTPKKNLAEEFERARREADAKRRHGNVYKELLPGMVIPLAIAMGTYAVSHSFPSRSQATDIEVSLARSSVRGRRPQIWEQAVKQRDSAIAHDHSSRATSQISSRRHMLQEETRAAINWGSSSCTSTPPIALPAPLRPATNPFSLFDLRT